MLTKKLQAADNELTKIISPLYKECEASFAEKIHCDLRLLLRTAIRSTVEEMVKEIVPEMKNLDFTLEPKYEWGHERVSDMRYGFNECVENITQRIEEYLK